LHLPEEIYNALVEADIVTMYELERALERDADIAGIDADGKASIQAALEQFKTLVPAKEKIDAK
jgi:hypothetical protein